MPDHDDRSLTKAPRAASLPRSRSIRPLRLGLFLALLLAGVAAAPAAVVEDKDRFGNVDGRGAITQKAEELGLSAADVEELRAATGYVICPGSTNGNGIVASAALVESNQLIITVGHAFVDENGLPRDPIGDCVFRSQAAPPTEVRMAGGDYLWVGLEGAAKPHDPNDYAVALLSRPVQGATPLRMNNPSADLGVGDHVIGIVAWQEIAGLKLDPGTPVVQDCVLRDFDASNGTQPTNYLTDCDLGPVGSGGHIVVKQGGQWVTGGVFSTSGGERSKGRSFSRRLGSYTRVIAVDGGLALAVERALKALR
jgi:hypothetical protein